MLSNDYKYLKNIASFYLYVNKRKEKEKVIHEKLSYLKNKKTIDIAKYILNKNIIVERKMKYISFWVPLEGFIEETVYYTNKKVSGYEMKLKKKKLIKL